MVKLLTEEASRKGVGDFQATQLVNGYWNKADGSDIEIDLVAVNEEDGVVRFGSCKRSPRQHTPHALKKFDNNINRFLKTKEGRRFSNWSIEKTLFSPVFSPDTVKKLEGSGYFCRDLPHYKSIL